MVQSTEKLLLPGRTSQVLLTDISIASPFDADASLNNIFILSRTMATMSAARRQLWLTTQKTNSRAKQLVVTALFQGGRLFGKLQNKVREFKWETQPALPKGRNEGFYSTKEGILLVSTVAPNTKAVCDKGLHWKVLHNSMIGTVPPGLYKVLHHQKLPTKEAVMKLSSGYIALANLLHLRTSATHISLFSWMRQPSAMLQRNIWNTCWFWHRIFCQKGQVHHLRQTQAMPFTIFTQHNFLLQD